MKKLRIYDVALPPAAALVGGGQAAFVLLILAVLGLAALAIWLISRAIKRKESGAEPPSEDKK